MPALSALTRAFPEDISPEHVSHEAFLWASQLWYSYAMHVSSQKSCAVQPFGRCACPLSFGYNALHLKNIFQPNLASSLQVEFPDGSVRQCLVPVACLMNHSPWPHVVRYGHIHPHSRRLKFPLFRYACMAPLHAPASLLTKRAVQPTTCCLRNAWLRWDCIVMLAGELMSSACILCSNAPIAPMQALQIRGTVPAVLWPAAQPYAAALLRVHPALKSHRHSATELPGNTTRHRWRSA